MGILIGMDEAGYGPNFGPLVVAATAWEVAEEGSGAGGRGSGKGESEEFRISDFGLRNGATQSQSAIRDRQSATGFPEVDLYRLLRNIVAKSASERRIAIADSKVLYHPGLGLRQLERGVHAVLAAIEQAAACWSTMVDVCGADPDGRHRGLAWHDGFNCALPIDAARGELDRLGARFVRACGAAGVRPLAIRARLVFPAQFNEMVEYYGTKGAALSHVTVGLLREVVDAIRQLSAPSARSPAFGPQPPIQAVCDKHGGRNFYTALLQHHFSEHWIEPTFESHRESQYEWGPPESRVRVAFRMNGERFLPTALASMTAKYLRELAMRAFNEFWCARVPGLRPTAGYPMDSRRYKESIAAAQRELGMDDHVLWRSR
jgi:hypothetical protein